MTRAKYFSLIATILLLFSTVNAQKQKQPSAAKPAVKEYKEYTIEQFMNTTRINSSAFSADEKSILFSSNKSGIWNA